MIIPTPLARDGAQSPAVSSNCRVIAGVKLCVEDIVVLVVLVVFILYAIWGVPLTIRLFKLLQRRLGREALPDVLPPGQSSDPYQSTTSPINDSVILKRVFFRTSSSPDAIFFPDTSSRSKATSFDIRTHSRQESGHGLGFGNSVATEPSDRQPTSTKSQELQIQELFHPPPAYMQHLEEKILL